MAADMMILGKRIRFYRLQADKTLEQLSESVGVVPSQLSLERYMKCGYGLCGNCVVDPLGIRLCTDGPVIKNDTCRKIEEFGKCHRDELGKKKEI
jgi:hypothetical protein